MAADAMAVTVRRLRRRVCAASALDSVTVSLVLSWADSREARTTCLLRHRLRSVAAMFAGSTSPVLVQAALAVRGSQGVRPGLLAALVAGGPGEERGEVDGVVRVALHEDDV